MRNSGKRVLFQDEVAEVVVVCLAVALGIARFGFVMVSNRLHGIAAILAMEMLKAVPVFALLQRSRKDSGRHRTVRARESQDPAPRDGQKLFPRFLAEDAEYRTPR